MIKAIPALQLKAVLKGLSNLATQILGLFKFSVRSPIPPLIRGTQRTKEKCSTAFLKQLKNIVFTCML